MEAGSPPSVHTEVEVGEAARTYSTFSPMQVYQILLTESWLRVGRQDRRSLHMRVALVDYRHLDP